MVRPDYLPRHVLLLLQPVLGGLLLLPLSLRGLLVFEGGAYAEALLLGCEHGPDFLHLELRHGKEVVRAHRLRVVDDRVGCDR